MPNIHRAAAPPRPNLPLRLSPATGDRPGGRFPDQASDSSQSRSCRAVGGPIQNAPTWEDLLGQR
jgi:hypothetical protein